MRHTRYLLTPAGALHRVLLLELANTASKRNGTPSTVLTSSSIFRKNALLPTSKHAHTPGTTTTSPCSRVRSFSTTSPAGAAQRMMVKQFPRDKDIKYKWVRVADKQGTLLAPQETSAVLASLPPGHSLVMVAPPPPPPPPGSVGGLAPFQVDAPICRIIDAAKEEAAKKEAALESKRMAQQTKTLELNWAIAPNDLAHKIKRFNDFLAKGMRVEMLLARKRGSRKATAEEGEELVRRIQEVASKAGAIEYKKMDGHVGNVVRFFFEGPKGKKKGKDEHDSSEATTT